MKKIFLSAFTLVALTMAAKAQSGVEFQARAGANFTTINVKNSDANKMKVGFHAGVDAAIPIAEEFYIQPGVLFSQKGSKYKNTDASTSLNYIEIPVSFMYKGQLGEGRFLLGVGPYAAFGISGKYKVGGVSADIDFGDNTGDTKRLDFGGNINAGYEFSPNLFAQLNFQLGMADISNGNTSVKNTGFGVSLGYRF